MNRIKQLRNEKGWTQTQLGKILNVKDSAVSKYESERIPLTAETIKEISTIFNVTSDYLLGRSDNPQMYTDQKNELSCTLTENETELLEIFRRITNERDQIKLIGRFDEIVEQMTNTSEIKSSDAPSTPSKENVG